MASSPSRLRINTERTRLSKCDSKKTSYLTKEEALDAAEHLMELGRVNPGCHITPYLCWDCHTWHVWNRPIVFTQPVDPDVR